MGVGWIVRPLLLATAGLLTSEDLRRVGDYADDRGGGHLFFDTSRNHSRRWCSMEKCGNRAKALRNCGRNQARTSLRLGRRTRPSSRSPVV